MTNAARCDDAVSDPRQRLLPQRTDRSLLRLLVDVINVHVGCARVTRSFNCSSGPLLVCSSEQRRKQRDSHELVAHDLCAACLPVCARAHVYAPLPACTLYVVLCECLSLRAATDPTNPDLVITRIPKFEIRTCLEDNVYKFL